MVMVTQPNALPRRCFRVMLGVTALLAGLVAGATPAAADHGSGGCGYSHGLYTYSDYAYVSDGNNSCGTIAVRHRYDPVWSGNNYWTSWESTSGTYARSDKAAEAIYLDSNSY